MFTKSRYQTNSVYPRPRPWKCDAFSWQKSAKFLQIMFFYATRFKHFFQGWDFLAWLLRLPFVKPSLWTNMSWKYFRKSRQSKYFSLLLVKHKELVFKFYYSFPSYIKQKTIYEISPSPLVFVCLTKLLLFGTEKIMWKCSSGGSSAKLLVCLSGAIFPVPFWCMIPTHQSPHTWNWGRG